MANAIHVNLIAWIVITPLLAIHAMMAITCQSLMCAPPALLDANSVIINCRAMSALTLLGTIPFTTPDSLANNAIIIVRAAPMIIAILPALQEYQSTYWWVKHA